MNSRQRVITALERKILDRIPHFEFVIDIKVIYKIIPGVDLSDFVDKIGLDAMRYN